VGNVFLKLLMSAIADVRQTVGDTDDLMAIGLSFHERDEIDVAVGCNGSPNAGSHEDDAHEIATAASTDVAQCQCHKFFEPRFVDRVRLFRRLRHRQEFRL